MKVRKRPSDASTSSPHSIGSSGKTAARGAAQPRRHPQTAHADERDLFGRHNRRATRRSTAGNRARRRDTRSTDRNETRRGSRRRAQRAPPRFAPRARRSDAPSCDRRRRATSVHETSTRPRGSHARRFSISSVLVLSSSVRFSRDAKNSTSSRLIAVSESNASESASSPVPTRKLRPRALAIKPVELVE